VQNITTFRDHLKFPSDEDLSGAAIALMRLQDTYKLDTASVARGELNGVQYSTELSGRPSDCVNIMVESVYRAPYTVKGPINSKGPHEL
jgi:prolyl 4-hydroxylase